MTITIPTARVLLSGAAAILMTFAFSTMTANAEQIRVQTMTPTHDLAAPDGGPLTDTYCGPNHVPWDQKFVDACKAAGGTMSGKQGWGGKTCWNS